MYNNETEYESLTIGMMMTTHIYVTNLAVKSVTNLVVKQVDGNFTAREPVLAMYRALIRRLRK